MKRILSLALTALMLCCAFVSAQASDFGLGDLGDLFGSMYNDSSDMMPKNITMPKQFSITYEYVENGKFREVTMEKDANDNYHYKDNEDEYLFVKDGKGYKVAIGTVNGFAYKNNDKYAFDYVKELTEKFWKCATPLDDDFTMGTTTEDGTGEVCGRKTNKFKVELGMSYSFGGYSAGLSEATYYDFDTETGICMASSSDEKASVMGMSSSDSDGGFECTRFELNDVTLPTID